MEAGGKKQVPRLFFAGTSRGVGLSSLLLGLLVCYRKQSVSIGTGSLSSSLVQTTHFRRIAGRLSHTWDPWLLSREAIRDSVIRLATGAEMIFVDGDRGLFDQFSEGSAYPTPADMALDLAFPIVLVVDASGYEESIEALLKGFMEYRPDLRISGVIATQLRDENHAERIRASAGRVRGLRFLGNMLHEPSLSGSLATTVGSDNPSLLTRNKLMALGDRVKSGIDLAALQALASAAGPVLGEPLVRVRDVGRCRIAVADDAAFHLTVQDNLDLMRRVGAEIVAFSPLADTRLPANITAVYLPSGYPHYYAADLAANKLMLTALREFAQKGGMVYAEGDAVAYCARKLTLFRGESVEMLGIIPGSATSSVDEQLPLESIECEVVPQKASILAPAGGSFRGLRNNRWLIRLDEPVLSCFNVRERGSKSQVALVDGYSPMPHILITTVQSHWGQILGNEGQALVRHFVEAAGV